MLKAAPVTLAVVALCLLLACAGAPLENAMAWRRGALLDGQLWRLWSAHLVHFSTAHALADALALLAAGLLAEPPVGARRFAAALAAGSALLSLALMVAAPAMTAYRGASGLVLFALGMAAAMTWRERRRARLPIACAAALLVVKTVFEARGHALGVTGLPADVEVAWQAHVLGALLGALCGALFSAMPPARPLTPSGSYCE